jgi:transposase-like protein
MATTKKIDAKIKALAEELVAENKDKNVLFGENGIAKQLQKRLLEAMLAGELTDHLGYDSHERHKGSNTRNGYTEKRLQSPSGQLDIEMPRDRESSFSPQIISKQQRRFDGLDDKIIALYARGMSTRDIQDQLKELYDVEVSSQLISTVSNEVMDEVLSWQNRPLDSSYPIVYLDCIVVKVREDKRIINKAVYLALGVNSEGHKELLGMWMSQNEGAKFWLNILTELKNRGLEHICIACVDGLTGFPEAIETAYPKARVQLCIVHMVRNSLKYVSWKDRKAVAADLKKIYTAQTGQEAEMALIAFAEAWDNKYPTISKSWLSKWEYLTPFFDYPKDIRRAIYTTNAIESLNMTLRKVIKNKRVFPSDNSVFKILYLALNNVAKKWSMPIQNWKSAMNHFIIEFGDNIVNM